MTAATLTARPPIDDRERTAQARRALLDANRTRVEKANIKRDVREGIVTLAEITATRPASLRAVPLFALLLELPGFGRRRLDTLNRRAIADGINLARTLGDASASTLDWLVRTVDADREADENATTNEAPPVVDHEPPAQGAARRLLAGVVGSYHAADDGHRRRLVLRAADDGTPVLVDRGGDDERVVERFRTTSGLLEVAAVARGYLDEARRLGRPVVAAGDPAAPTQCSADKTDPREQMR
jgi:hypothetical protein